MHAAATRSDAEQASRRVQPKRRRCVPGRAAPAPTLAHVPSAEARPGGGAPEGARRPDLAADRRAGRRHGCNRPGAARRRSVGVAAAADGVIGSERLAAGALAGFALRTQSCRAGRAEACAALRRRPDLPHAATADAVGTGGAFAPASRRDGSRRPRTIFCKRLRLSDQLAMWEGCGGPLPRAGLRRRQNRLSGAGPRMRRPVRPRRPITGRSGAPTRRGARGFMPRRSRPRSGGAAGRDARTPPFPSPPARMRHRSRQPTI